MSAYENLDKKIRPIDKNTVNQICSGQVILTLATAVKELLENSLDANASSIQVKLKEHGSESIEVIDNGYGVEDKNFEGLTLKHYTSKIAVFEDLEKVETFGFRGEALSSLCSLGNIVIITRHIDASCGTCLRFDNNGRIKESSKIARQVGTTVLIENLFSTLPVRHKEFLRNIKKEFGKLCNVLQAYALLNFHCSFSCLNRVAGKSRQVMETRVGSLRENIGSIFGSKQLADIIEIKSITPSPEILSDFCCKSTSPAVTISGFISLCSHGSGRSAADRQYVYINSRPVDNTKVMRLVNEIYHQFNSHQQPFVILNISLSTDSVDVNVVPDKRQILIENENLVLATIKASLVELFQSTPSTLNLQLSRLSESNLLHCTENSSVKNLSRFCVNGAQSPTECSKVKAKQKPLSAFFQKQVERNANVLEPDVPAAKKIKLESSVESSKSKEDNVNQNNEVSAPLILNEKSFEVPTSNYKVEILESISLASNESIKSINEMDSEQIPCKRSDIEQAITNQSIKMCDNLIKEIRDSGITEEEKNQRARIFSSVTMDDIKKMRTKFTRVENHTVDVKFFAKIEPSSNERAEKELRKELSQEAFLEMKILGQFNKGFIITKLEKNLFIIDQHATDEKGNFEMLSKKGIQSQRLAIPQQLCLTADKEELMQDRCELIRANGYEFSVNISAAVTNRISLTSVPTLRGITLGSRDLDELLFLLVDSREGEMCRPSKVRDILASKACRMSVMVGDALNAEQMQRLVRRMKELDQPWNCPHGRPTIRHLISLNLISSSPEIMTPA